MSDSSSSDDGYPGMNIRNKAVANAMGSMQPKVNERMRKTSVADKDPVVAAGLADIRARMGAMREARELVDGCFSDNKAAFGHLMGDVSSTEYESENETSTFQQRKNFMDNMKQKEQELKDLQEASADKDRQISNFQLEVTDLKSAIDYHNEARQQKAGEVLKVLQECASDYNLTRVFSGWQRQAISGPLARRLEKVQEKADKVAAFKKRKGEQSVKQWNGAHERRSLVSVLRAWQEEALLNSFEKEVQGLHADKEKLEKQMEELNIKAKQDLEDLKDSVSKNLGDAAAAQSNLLVFQAEAQNNKRLLDIQTAKTDELNGLVTKLEDEVGIEREAKRQCMLALNDFQTKYNTEIDEFTQRVQTLEKYMNEKDAKIQKLTAALEEADVENMKRLQKENAEMKHAISMLQGEKYGVDERITMAKKEVESARADAFCTTALWVKRESKYLDTIRELDWENQSFRRQYFPEDPPPPPTLKTWEMMQKPTPQRRRKTSHAGFLPNIIVANKPSVGKMMNQKQIERNLMRKTWRG